MKYLIIYGTLVDGIWFEGPYESLGDARKEADQGEPYTVEFLHDPKGLSAATYLPKISDGASILVAQLIKAFPGLVNAVDEVNGGDLVHYLTSCLARQREAKESLHTSMNPLADSDLELTGEIASAFIEYANTHYHQEGHIEIDEPGADLSESLKGISSSGNLAEIFESGGLYVKAWVWVDLFDLPDHEEFFGRFRGESE